MKNIRKLVLISFVILTMIAPHIADARAGGGRSSMGSRGARTYSAPNNYKAQPIQRSTTSKPTQQPAAQPGFASPQPAGMPNIGGGGSFWRGMAGGFLGAGIGSLLFGSHGYASGGAGGAGGASGAGSAFGGLLQILLIGGMAYLGYRLFRGRAAAGGNFAPANSFSGNFASNNNYAAQEVDDSTPLNITDHDKNAFEQVLQKVQHHWSEGDLIKLRMFVTPEMLQYFSEELSSNSSRGIANIVENITLDYAEILESWREFSLDYATARLQWSAYDYMVRLDKNPSDSDYVASGSKTELVQAEEMWTFVRSSGGNWLLSAIQQVG